MSEEDAGQESLAEEDSPGTKTNVERRVESFLRDRFSALEIHDLRGHRLDAPDAPATDEGRLLQVVNKIITPDTWKLAAAHLGLIRKERHFGEAVKNAPTAGGVQEVQEGDDFVA
jgi:hypothetical protein